MIICPDGFAKRHGERAEMGLSENSLHCLDVHCRLCGGGRNDGVLQEAVSKIVPENYNFMRKKDNPRGT